MTITFTEARSIADWQLPIADFGQNTTPQFIVVWKTGRGSGGGVGRSYLNLPQIGDKQSAIHTIAYLS
ncbi:MAG: hypothetical protein M3447_07440 [Acidobacteriota bacterium]|nr:hypothetical protein [Acidobacteriota bacterium]